MSKYTTEVRYICEHLSGLNESEGYNSVSTIIANAKGKIFDFVYPIFDESYRGVLETKILKHFYTREIGEETVGLWKLRLDTKLNEIMPYYNEIYKTQLAIIDPFRTTDITTERQSIGNSNRTTDEDIGDTSNANTTSLNNSSNSANGKSNTRSLNNSENDVTSRGLNDRGETVDNRSMDLYSDTPQGSLTGIDADVPTYLTNARKVTNNGISNGHTYNVDIGKSNSTNNSVGVDENESTENHTESGIQSSANKYTRDRSVSEDANSVENFIEHTYGYNGFITSDLLKKYREIFMNIDMLVINELEPLFMQLW